MQLSPHFTRHEMERSQASTREGIRNVMDARQIENYRAHCVEVLEPLRAVVEQRFDVPPIVMVSSGFRCPQLNDAVGGAKHSEHHADDDLAATDVEIFGLNNASLAALILELDLPFETLILEFHDVNIGPNSGWLHISHRRNGANRRYTFTKTRQGGRVIDLPGLVAPPPDESML